MLSLYVLGIEQSRYYGDGMQNVYLGSQSPFVLEDPSAYGELIRCCVHLPISKINFVPGDLLLFRLYDIIRTEDLI